MPGLVDETDGKVSFRDGPGADSYDVLDEIACRSLLKGARVLSAREGRHSPRWAARGDPSLRGLGSSTMPDCAGDADRHSR